jgi:hypothetical protein
MVIVSFIIDKDRQISYSLMAGMNMATRSCGKIIISDNPTTVSSDLQTLK